MRKKLFIAILTFSILSLLFAYPEKEINKKYFNNLLDGGIPRILDKNFSCDKDVNLDSIYINITLFKGYSIVDINCKIRNNGKDKKIFFAYPRLDAKIVKIITNLDKKGKREILREGNYINYNVRVNGLSTKYTIENADLPELKYPFKVGDLIRIGNDLSKPRYEEIVDSFNLYYSWYISEIDIKKDENKSIRVTYTTSHYYNSIIFKNLAKNENLEDPALKYFSLLVDDSSSYYESEKIFFFPFSSSYMEKNSIIDKIIIKISANVIDQDFLKVNPINFKNRRKIYYWRYSKLKPQLINDILVKISSMYSKNSYNPLLFATNKNLDLNNCNYELSGNNDEILFKYKGDDSIPIKSVRILPEYIKYKSDFKIKNIPLEFEVSFSNYEDFSNSKIFFKRYSKKKYLRNMNRKSYLEIYDGKEINCKYIKIRVLKSSKANEKIIINDVEFLK